MLGKEVGLQLFSRHPLLLGQLGKEVAHTFRTRRPRQHRIHRHPGAGQGLGQPARHRQQRSLGHAVMNHLGRDLQRRLTGQEHHSPPFAFGHARGIVA